MYRKTIVIINLVSFLAIAIYIGQEAYFGGVGLGELPCFHYCVDKDCSLDGDTPKEELAKDCRMYCGENKKEFDSKDPLIGEDPEEGLAPIVYWLTIVAWPLSINPLLFFILGAIAWVKKDKARGWRLIGWGSLLFVLTALIMLAVIALIGGSHLTACL